MPGDNHLFALLDQIEQLTKPASCLEGADLPHGEPRKTELPLPALSPHPRANKCNGGQRSQQAVSRG